MTHEEFTTNLAEVGRLQSLVKQRSMIYNVIEKELAARWLCLPLDSFHDLPFVQWRDAARFYHRYAHA